MEIISTSQATPVVKLPVVVMLLFSTIASLPDNDKPNTELPEALILLPTISVWTSPPQLAV